MGKKLTNYGLSDYGLTEKKDLNIGELVDSIYCDFNELAFMITPCLSLDEIRKIQIKSSFLMLSDFYFDTKDELILSFVRHYIDEHPYTRDLYTLLNIATKFTDILNIKYTTKQEEK